VTDLVGVAQRNLGSVPTDDQLGVTTRLANLPAIQDGVWASRVYAGIKHGKIIGLWKTSQVTRGYHSEGRRHTVVGLHAFSVKSNLKPLLGLCVHQ
jgi:hypothetical protein